MGGAKMDGRWRSKWNGSDGNGILRVALWNGAYT